MDIASNKVFAMVMLSRLGFVRTKDGHNELYYSSLFRVLTISGMESVFRIMLRLKFPYMKTILAAVPVLAFLRQKHVNFSPYLGRPLLGIMPNCPKPLVSPLK